MPVLPARHTDRVHLPPQDTRNCSTYHIRYSAYTKPHPFPRSGIHRPRREATSRRRVLGMAEELQGRMAVVIIRPRPTARRSRPSTRRQQQKESASVWLSVGGIADIRSAPPRRLPILTVLATNRLDDLLHPGLRTVPIPPAEFGDRDTGFDAAGVSFVLEGEEVALPEVPAPDAAGVGPMGNPGAFGGAWPQMSGRFHRREGDCRE